MSFKETLFLTCPCTSHFTSSCCSSTKSINRADVRTVQQSFVFIDVYCVGFFIPNMRGRKEINPTWLSQLIIQVEFIQFADNISEYHRPKPDLLFDKMPSQLRLLKFYKEAFKFPRCPSKYPFRVINLKTTFFSKDKKHSSDTNAYVWVSLRLHWGCTGNLGLF